MDIETFLNQEGYEIGTKKATYFSIVLEAVVSMMNNNIPNKEIRENLKELIDLYCSRMFHCTESHFYYEAKYFIKTNKKQQRKYITKTNVETKLIQLARKYKTEIEKENKDQKIYKKIKKEIMKY